MCIYFMVQDVESFPNVVCVAEVIFVCAGSGAEHHNGSDYPGACHSGALFSLHRFLSMSFTGSYRCPSQVPIDVLHRFLSMSFTGFYRCPSQVPIDVLHRFLSMSFTGSYRCPAQVSIDVFHRFLSMSFREGS